MNGSAADKARRIDRLMDAIELLKIDRREDARQVLRELIHEDGNFEEAWLWMSVAVDTVDESSVCLDNVLRVNPRNTQAAGALYRIRETEIHMGIRREKLRAYHNLVVMFFWVLFMTLLFVVLFTYQG